MQMRNKWQAPERNMQVGDLVYLIDENQPPGKWMMGRVAVVYPGKDGLVRNIDVQTTNGAYRRAVQRCCRLPCERDYQQMRHHPGQEETSSRPGEERIAAAHTIA